MSRTGASATLVDAAARSDAPSWAVKLAAMLFVAALTAAAAQLSVPLPFTDVPFTFQPMVVLLGGLALGSKLALGSQVLYLLAGLAGLPVFAPSATLPPGALRLMGPTGGYLMSYPIAALLVGALAERGFDRRYITSVLAMLAGLAVVYGCGALWLAFFAQERSAGGPHGLAGGARGGRLSVHRRGPREAACRRRHLADALASGRTATAVISSLRCYRTAIVRAAYAHRPDDRRQRPQRRRRHPGRSQDLRRAWRVRPERHHRCDGAEYDSASSASRRSRPIS